MTLKLQEIVDALAGEFNARLIGDGSVPIVRLAGLEQAGEQDLSFLNNKKYTSKLAAAKAACVIVAPWAEQAAVQRGRCIVVDDPYHYFARVTQFWKQRYAAAPTGPAIHPTASIDPGAQIGAHARVGAFTVIGPDAVVGAGAVISEHCVLGEGSGVGAHTHFAPRVTLAAGCSIGERGIVHSGVVIGADGFGFAPHKGKWIKIEQLGAVKIGDDVEIGANTCIDRGALEDTVIENGVKLDNLIQIGHNVRVGAHTAMAGCVGVAGSAVIGAHCTVGGGAVVLGHLAIADHVHISAASVVTRSITQAGNYTGFFPLDDNATWEKNAASVKQLSVLRDRIKQLEKAIVLKADS